MSPYPKYNLEDYVFYDGKVYKITSVHAINWFMSIPFVYGLVLAHTDPKEPYAHKELYVIEQLLNIASNNQIGVWKTLYGRR